MFGQFTSPTFGKSSSSSLRGQCSSDQSYPRTRRQRQICTRSRCHIDLLAGKLAWCIASLVPRAFAGGSIGPRHLQPCHHFTSHEKLSPKASAIDLQCRSLMVGVEDWTLSPNKIRGLHNTYPVQLRLRCLCEFGRAKVCGTVSPIWLWLCHSSWMAGHGHGFFRCSCQAHDLFFFPQAATMMLISTLLQPDE